MSAGRDDAASIRGASVATRPHWVRDRAHERERARRAAAGRRPTSSTSTPSSAPTTTSGRTRRTPAQRVAFGTSGHRGTSTRTDLQRGPRARDRRGGLPLPRRSRASTARSSSGRDTHALSEPAARTHRRGARRARRRRRGRRRRRLHPDARRSRTRSSPTTAAARRGTADGIVVTPSHNPPEDGGFKYNPPHGGPADTDVTGWIEREANALLESGPARRRAHADGRAPRSRRRDYVSAYVDDLPAVIDLDAIRDSGLRLGVDPLGGASVAYWAAIAERHGLDLTITNDQRRPDLPLRPAATGTARSAWTARRRTRWPSCASWPTSFDVAFANDPDADRHGIVTPGAGLLNPNHHLAVCIAYLFGGAPRLARGHGASARRSSRARSSTASPPTSAGAWSRSRSASSGSSTGCSTAALGFGGEESAGASFLRRDGDAVVDRQGRPDPVPAGGRDDRHDGDGPGRALRRR